MLRLLKMLAAAKRARLIAHTSEQGEKGAIGENLLAVLIFLIPLLGQIVLSIDILREKLSIGERFLWLPAVWLFPVLGPLLYLLLGQRLSRYLARRPRRSLLPPAAL
jgi:hypothetical protein